MDLSVTRFLKPCNRLLAASALSISIVGIIDHTQADNQRPLRSVAPTLVSEQLRQLTQRQQLSHHNRLSQLLEQSNLTPEQKQLLTRTLSQLQGSDSIDNGLRKQFREMTRNDPRLRKLAEDIAKNLPFPQTPDGLSDQPPFADSDIDPSGWSRNEPGTDTQSPQPNDRQQFDHLRSSRQARDRSQPPSRRPTAERTPNPDTMTPVERLREELRPLDAQLPPRFPNRNGQFQVPSRSPAPAGSSPGLSRSPEQDDSSPDRVAEQFDALDSRRQTQASGNLSEQSAATARPPTSGIDWQEELTQKGVRKTVKRLLEEAQKNVRKKALSQTGPSADDSSIQTTFSRTITTVVDHLRENAGDTITEIRRQIRSEPQSGPNDVTRRFRPNQNGVNSASQSTEAQEALSPPQNDRQPATQPGLPSIDNLIPELPEDIGTAPLLGLLLLAGLIGGSLLLTTRRRRTSRLSSSQPIRVRPIQSTQIQSREDVIHAYHWLTQSTAPDSAAWWNHRQAMDSMTTWAPDRSTAIQQLAALYEAARYEAQRDSFGPERIQQAQAAMAGCEP